MCYICVIIIIPDMNKEENKIQYVDIKQAIEDFKKLKDQEDTDIVNSLSDIFDDIGIDKPIMSAMNKLQEVKDIMAKDGLKMFDAVKRVVNSVKAEIANTPINTKPIDIPSKPLQDQVNKEDRPDTTKEDTKDEETQEKLSLEDSGLTEEEIREHIREQAEYDADPLNYIILDDSINMIWHTNIKKGKEYLDEAKTQKRINHGGNRILVVNLNQEEFWMQDILTQLPLGLIDKQITGIGATTLEIVSKRNSIIVVPTKALAYNKHKKHPGTMYVGSSIERPDIGDRPEITIKEYLTNKHILHKKFLVVADSLKFLIESIVESNLYKDVYSDFFLVVDEIDVLQTDSYYRPKLEIVMDYYFKFKAQRRCLVSATVNYFSHPKLQWECRTIFQKEVPQRNISLIYTNNINLKVSEKIKKLPKEDKILIAYNSIRNILQVIRLLDENMQAECGILCSDSSEAEVGDYYTSIKDGKLKKRITFMTSTYFTGIDIEENCHLITVSNADKTYSRLSINRMTQIYGRCRDEKTDEGYKSRILSDTIIYNTFNKEVAEKLDSYRDKLLSKAGKVIDLLNAAEALQRNDENITDLFKRIKHLIIEKADERILNNSSAYKLTRTDIDGNPQISYFNIDALYMELETCIKYYSGSESLYKALKDRHKVTFTNDFYYETDNLKAIASEVSEDLKVKKQTQLDRAKEKLMGCIDEGVFMDDKFADLARKSNGVEKVFFDRIKRHGSYIYLDTLANLLADNKNFNKKSYRNLRNTISFWVLDPRHPFKKQLLETFIIGNKYKSDEVVEKMNMIFKYHLFKKTIKKYRAVNFLRSVFDTTYTGGKYRIKSINPQNLPDPLKMIPEGETNINRHFDI